MLQSWDRKEQDTTQQLNDNKWPRGASDRETSRHNVFQQMLEGLGAISQGPLKDSQGKL